MKINNKLIVLSLCTGIVFSSFGGITFGSDNKGSNQELVQPGLQLTPPTDSFQAEYEEVIIDGTEQEAALYTGTTSRLGGEYTIDPHTVDGEELEKLLNEGYELKEIFNADEIANQVGLAPVDILTANVDGLSVGELREEVLKQRENSLKMKLKAEFSSDFSELQSLDLTEDEVYVLLLGKKENAELNIAEIAENYQAQGKSSINDMLLMIENNEIQKSNITDTQQNDVNLDKENAKANRLIIQNDISPNLVEKFRAFAEANKISLEGLLENYINEKERQDNHVKISEGGK
ncbi:hypothetical protein [Paenibacillus sp. YIM B09110]|uniref:hypothetical protein n=1 Tax=Paenibacillus sp. YIM B09110 TaxID=3126102 RepID=UPI00301E2B40